MIEREMKLPSLICPICKASIAEFADDTVRCSGNTVHVFPIVSEVPILINDSNSVFAVDDYIESIDPEIGDSNISDGMWNSKKSVSKLSSIRQVYRKFAGWLTEFVVQTDRLTTADAVELVIGRQDPKILVIGSGERNLPDDINADLIYTDVAIGDGVAYVCDAHDLPFEDGSFDLVVAEAVLEHVADPYRVVDEIHRVLKADGIVFASTPFLQPIHLGPYDFTRFTLTGYRRLFRDFEETHLEPALGPGSSMAYSIQYFLTSLADARALKSILNLVGLIISRPFKYIDKWRLKQKGALAFAAGYVFIGTKSGSRLSDRELVRIFSSRI